MTLIDFGIFLNLFFNGHVLFKGVFPFEFYVGYAPMILLLMIFMAKYKFPRETLYILLPLLLTGLLNIFVNNNTFNNLFKIFANVAINLVFYRYVIQYYEYDVKRIFRLYLKFAYIVCVIGLIQWVSYLIGFVPGYNWKMFLPLNKWSVNLGGIGIRINSTLSEPSYFGTIIAPAFFIAAYEFFFKKDNFYTRTQCLLIIIVYILSFSSLAIIGIFLSLLLVAINFGFIRYVFLAIPVTILLYSVAYNNMDEFRQRMMGMKALFIDNLVEKELSGNMETGVRMYKVSKILPQIHGSSFVLYNNYHVAVQNFKQNPLFGSGLGSHEQAYKNFKLNYLLGGIYEFNSADANSMFLRIISELGIMGVLFVFMFTFKFYVAKNLAAEEDEEYWLISNALLVLILIQLLRQGNYTFSGFFLYAWMYYFNRIRYMEYKEEKSSGNVIGEMHDEKLISN